MNTYAETLQEALIDDHSGKSLRELTGGWEIVRTEDAPRVATLANEVSVSTRWSNDIPASYRATLNIQSAGFNHTFDLPSIYAWRVQAQIKGRTLEVAVRNREHEDAAATAYFGISQWSPRCDGTTVICGSDPGQTSFDADGRRLVMTVNHPYAAAAHSSASLGTFADETVIKAIEVSRRTDILIRTAGGSGQRKALWSAAHDPIQEHRIIPSGDDYNNCVLMDDDTPIEAEECDGHGAQDWRYWVQSSETPGFHLFPVGEVAAAEMGLKKDTLLNAWTDLFDRTTQMLEGLSGARIFHQHSIGVALSPGYGENQLDIDTAVGVMTVGSDRPHHVLSALAALAATEEALAIGQVATERPQFQGSSLQTSGPTRFAASPSGVKVLTSPGATTGLPANVSADTRAQIEAYLNAGFEVAVTTSGQNAFLARRADGSEQAWILRTESTNQLPDTTNRIAFRKGAEGVAPEPLDYLGKSEERMIAANVAGTHLGAVDLRTGGLSFGEGTELSVGQGDFPYSLSFSRSYSSGGAVEGVGGLGMGWSHNWESSVGRSTDVEALLPRAEAVTAAPMLIAALIALEAGRAETLQAAMVSGVVTNWLQEQAAHNVISVNGGGRSARFVRLVDGTWRNPASPTETLAPKPGGSILTYSTEFDWTLADRSVMKFRDFDSPPGQHYLGRKGAMTSWVFPTGMEVTLTYTGQSTTNPPRLSKVANNLGAELVFEHAQAPTQSTTDTCYSNAAALGWSNGRRAAEQVCYEAVQSGGRLLKVSAGEDEISFGYTVNCPQNVNFCAFSLVVASRPGLRTRYYDYETPTGALANAVLPMQYQQLLAVVTDAGVATPRARFVWKAVGGQVAPYVETSYDAQDRATTYYSTGLTYSSAKNALDGVVSQAYDEDGRLVASTDEENRTAHAAYDGPGRTTFVRTPWGDKRLFKYDARGNLIERRLEPRDDCADGRDAWGQSWLCQTIVVTATYHTTWNKPISVTLPATTAGDANTQTWTIAYNAKGLVSSVTAPEVFDSVGNTTAHPVWSTWYDAYGRVTRTQDPTGRETTQTWGGGGLPDFCLRQTKQAAQSGSSLTDLISTYACDAVGNVTSVTDPRGHTTTTGYDDLRRKTSETGPSGTNIQTQWVYDLNGDLKEEKRWDHAASTWRTTTTTYSATRKPLTVTDPAGDVARTCYDALDRPIAVIDGQLRATVTDYNAAHQPVAIRRWRVADANSCTISVAADAPTETRWRRMTYTSGGMLLTETDANGNVTTLDYDGLGRLFRTIYPDGTQAWTLTDERGQARFRGRRANDWAVIYYDAAGRDYHVTEHVAGSAPLEGRNVRAGLDLAGRPVWRDVSTQGASWDDALLRDVRLYAYDDAGRLTTDQWKPEGHAAGPTLTLTYGYDAAGNRTSITWPGSWTATYAFDAANRPISATFPGGGGTRTVAMSYDSLSRRTGIDRPGSAADTAYAYEIDSDLASLSHGFTPATGPGAVSFSYGHDASGKVTSIGIDQPAFEWAPTLGYARTYGTPNNLNQVTSENSVAVTWDANGNMTTDGTNTYTWTFGNRLAGASRSGMTATYIYDSDDRRTKKIVNGVTTRTLWSGADELAELDASGNVLRYIIPDGSGAMDARLAVVDASTGAVAWLHTDHQGSVIATSNDAGEVIEAVSYSPYGEFGPGQSAPPAGSPFGYTGRQFDPETGLYQYRARYYHTRLGVFLSNDPIGTKDDPNLYGYVGLDPVNATDPTGRDIIVLNDTFALGPPLRVDHQAVLIGSGNVWTFVSKDGAVGGGLRGPSVVSGRTYRMPLESVLRLPELTRYERGVLSG